MVSFDESIIARIAKGGKTFEVLVDPNLSLKLRHNEQVNFNDLVAIDKIFYDAKKGDEAKASDLSKFFGTTDVKAITEKIIKEGEVQLTTQQRKELTEKKRAEIINLIALNAFNPQTKTPHPPQRIELGLEQLKIHVDPLKPAKDQIPAIIEKLRVLMPLSMASLKLRVFIPAVHAGRASNVVHQFKIVREEWKNNGGLEAVIELPAGMKEAFFSKINAATQGNVEVEVLEEK